MPLTAEQGQKAQGFLQKSLSTLSSSGEVSFMNTKNRRYGFSVPFYRWQPHTESLFGMVLQLPDLKRLRWAWGPCLSETTTDIPRELRHHSDAVDAYALENWSKNLIPVVVIPHHTAAQVENLPRICSWQPLAKVVRSSKVSSTKDISHIRDMKSCLGDRPQPWNSSRPSKETECSGSLWLFLGRIISFCAFNRRRKTEQSSALSGLALPFLSRWSIHHSHGR